MERMEREVGEGSLDYTGSTFPPGFLRLPVPALKTVVLILPQSLRGSKCKR